MMDKKLIKQFLKPNWKKNLIVLIFISFSYFFKVNCLPAEMLGACEEYGFPMAYLEMSSGDFAYIPQYFILWFGLIMDLIFWYFVSSGIIFTYNKFKTKK